MKSTFKRNIQIGFGLSLLILIISSAASYMSINALLDSSRMVGHTNQVIQELDNMMLIMKDAETSQRGYLLTDLEEFLEPYKGIRQRALASQTHVRELTSDNPFQQKNADQLEGLIEKRIIYMERVISLKKTGRPLNLLYLQQGRDAMDEIEVLVESMKDHERGLLAERTRNMNRYASYTPVLIMIAAVLSLIITVFFYIKVSRDFAEKTKLQHDLEAKDLEIRNRIAIIQDIADKISTGNYKIRVDDSQDDDLGSLSVALNKMAESLDVSFTQLHHKEWLQSGIAGLNEIMVGEKTIDQLTNDTIQFIADFTHSQVAAFYLLEDSGKLKLAGSFAIDDRSKRQFISLGEGIVGQCAKSGKSILLNEISPDDIIISFASGDLKPASIAAIPIFHEYKLVGVLEIGSLTPITNTIMEFTASIVNNVGIAIYTSQIRRKQQELLEETQSQAEELQTQHGELEALNTELITQTEKIQASEEELRVQQEELMQSNQELEERSRLLEQKNQIIVERNLDIQQKSEQLELSTKYKSEFLANMSHELRTPLNSILLLSRLMSENKDLDKEQVEYARVIQSAGQGLLSLIDEILDLSKIESGKMELELRSVTLKEINNDLRSLFDPLAKEKGIDLQFNIDPSAPEIIVTDKLRLEQILKNLLSNALKFTARGSIVLNISPAENPDLIKFNVKDTGIGIAKEKQNQVFEAFQQADGSTRRKFGGTGLGLSISRELAKLLGGEIKLLSTPGTGSEFIVIIPASKTNISMNKPPEPKEIVKELPVVKPERFRSLLVPHEIDDDRNNLLDDDKIILIIEDDTIFAKALLDYTRKHHYKGIVAVRGDQGLEMATIYKPVAILLDIQLPVKDGWEVMEELKADPATRHIPIHIMSSMEVKKESLLKGAVDFINKPIALDDMNQIFKKLEDALSKHPKKVLIIEENPKHAKALGYFLSNFGINSETSESVAGGINLLNKKEVDCVILDMGIPDQNAYETLEKVKSSPGLENLPIIIFTGKSLSKGEENKIKQYADSIVVKTAHSYQRILDEVGLFLHLVEDNKKVKTTARTKTLGGMDEVLKGKTVLIADDDVRNIFSLTKALEKHNMNIVSAMDGKDALKILDDNPSVDIVLMDMMMPEMDGYESTSQIRRNPKYKQLPILAVTAKAMMGDREKCIKAGASDYISKPVDLDQLISLLRVWLYDKK